MKVFDFDGTLYDGDSTVDFYLFCLRRHPIMAWSLFPCGFDAARFKLGRLDRQVFKERYFKRFLPRVDTCAEVSAFWKSHRKRLNEWCVALLSSGDVVASASSAFLLEPLCKEWGVELLATDVDLETGSFRSLNCRGEQKAAAFLERYGELEIEAFYTDDVTADAPMMALAKAAYIVRDNNIEIVH